MSLRTPLWERFPGGTRQERQRAGKKKHHKTFRMMKRQRANADNNTLGRSIYQNNLRLQANSVKMGPAFKMHQRYDKNAERKTHARGRRWISSSESLSLGRGFWDSNEGLDTETPGCRLSFVTFDQFKVSLLNKNNLFKNKSLPQSFDW